MSEKQPKLHIMTERQWRNLTYKFDRMALSIEALERRLADQKAKKYLKFDECIPPSSVCRDVLSMLEGIRGYEGFIGRLSEYYGCEPMRMLVDPGNKVSDKAIATYYWAEKTAYSKGNSCSQNTVLHEFFHHMQNCKVVVVDKEQEEKCADKFASIFLSRAAST